MKAISQDVIVRLGRSPPIRRKIVGDGKVVEEASYSVARLPWLIEPLRLFPVGMYPFGHEWDHLK